jgi:hypothetical protein
VDPSALGVEVHVGPASSMPPSYLPPEIIRSLALHPMIHMIINIPGYSVPVSKRKQPRALLMRTTPYDLIAAIEDAAHPSHQMLTPCRMMKLALCYVYWRATVKRRGWDG